MHVDRQNAGGRPAVWECPRAEGRSRRTKVMCPHTGEVKPAAPAGRGRRKKRRYLPCRASEVFKRLEGCSAEWGHGGCDGWGRTSNSLPTRIPESQQPRDASSRRWHTASLGDGPQNPKTTSGNARRYLLRNSPQKLATRIHLTVKPHPEIPINP